MNTISDNLTHTHSLIDEACHNARRPVGSVRLLAVSKTFGVDAIAEAIACGQRAFGENYIQEGVEKIRWFAKRAPTFDAAQPLEWHCIGPVQSNKTRSVAEHFDWVHTIDRLKIAQRLSDQRPEALPPLQVCIQINVDGGATKSGIAPHEAEQLVREIAPLPRLVVRGVMSIPDAAPNEDTQLAIHQHARAVFDDIARLGLPQLAHWDTVSMGMTADLQAAIRAGSTMVRVGSGIFGRRNYADA